MNCGAPDIFLKKQGLGIKPGLSRIRAMLDFADNPQNKIKIVHIAGTNGKGTVASIIARSLETNGKKVGLFTSPWVTDYCEQISINGRFITNSELSDAAHFFDGFDCTEFELLTAAAYKYFFDCSVDFAVIECGMGGKNDCTNTEEKNLAVITSISLDHTDFLGSDLEAIAAEKSGILRPDCDCVLYPGSGLEHIFKPKCRRLIVAKDCNNIDENNIATAKAALDILGARLCLDGLFLPARREKIGSVLLDGGHNVGAAKALEPFLKNETAVIGMLCDKDVEGYLSIIAPHCKKIFATQIKNPRSLSAKNLAEIAKKYCSDVDICPDSARAAALAKKSGLSLVCGSFYLAREVRNLI